MQQDIILWNFLFDEENYILYKVNKLCHDIRRADYLNSF